LRTHHAIEVAGVLTHRPAMRGVLPGARKPNVAGELTHQPRQAVAVGDTTARS